MRSFCTALCLALLAAPAVAQEGVQAPQGGARSEPQANEVTSWSPFAEADVVRIVTQDEDGEERDTPVWFVVVGGDGFVRTNDSRWLANIRRGSSVVLRLDPAERAVTAEEATDAAVSSAVEEAFKAKYGFVQRIMSAFRVREPTVLRLREKAS